MQEVSCLLDTVGIGVSQAIGVGGRDLSADVGGLMTHRALDLLIEDPMTGSIVVLSKPPDPSLMDDLFAHAADSPKPIVLGLLGSVAAVPLARSSAELQVVHSLEEAAARTATIHGRTLPMPDPSMSAITHGFVRGLFCGGSLCYEAMGIAASALGPIQSNTPLRPEWGLPTDGSAGGHAMLDLGEEAFTDGRPHPMIDPSLRNEWALREGLDRSVGVLLLDVILGFGAHPDPAGSLAPIVEEVLRLRDGEVTVLVSVCGTESDPQELDRQCRSLESVGAFVTRRAADAARRAVVASGAAIRSPAEARPGKTT
jgi:FdrA protein